MKKSKCLLATLITGTSILATIGTSVSCRIAKDGYVGLVYDIDKSTIVSDCNRRNILDNPPFSKYSSFSERIIDNEIKTPIYDEMVPQGLTIMRDYILTTSYDYGGVNNSVVYVLNRDGDELNKCFLEFRSHVGGIAFDEAHNLVWIPGNNGEINAYLADDFVNQTSVSAIYSNLNVGEKLLNYKNPLKNSIAYLAIFNDELYVGSFSLSSPGLVKRYSINVSSDGVISLGYKGEFKVPTMVQGLSFYNKGDNNYIMFSRSFGKNNPSLLQIFHFSLDITDYTSEDLLYISYEAPSMMEQVAIDDSDLYSIFESGAYPYRGCADQLDNICVLDADELIGPLMQKRY